MNREITVSNGTEFKRIRASELEELLDAGFYRPAEFGMTIVGNRDYQFEIPIVDAQRARSNGFVDLLADEYDADHYVADHIGNAQPTLEANAATTHEPHLQSLLISELSLAEAQTQSEMRRQEHELAEAKGIAWYLLRARQWLAMRQTFLQRQLGTHSISILIHVAIFLLLASLVLVDDTQEKAVLIASIAAPRDAIDEVIIEPDTLEITEPTETEPDDAPPESLEIEAAETKLEAVDFMAAVSGEAVKPPSSPSKTDGDGKTMNKNSSAVFGTQVTANDYIFVIDNSNSMGGGRFETALNELMIAVKGLNRKQRFYVIFYSDTAYGMMYPNPVTQMVVANDLNKQRLYRWLATVPLCLKTNGKEAIQAAFNMKPDVIYVLGDGAFTDNASKYFATQPRTKTILHTRGMQVSSGLAKSFEALAKAHGGNYKDVGVAPNAAAMAKRNPRPKLRKRNGAWGLMLPVN